MTPRGAGGVRRLASRGLRVALRPWTRAKGTIVGADVQRPVAALTFDDGPDPRTTPELLGLLSRHGIKATFFCVGKHAEENPEILRRMHEEGHAIGNHTWDHPSMPHVGRTERRRQVELCARALAPYEAPLFRPPYGSQSILSHLEIVRLGYDVITWDVDGQDWLHQDEKEISHRIQNRIRPGSIVLLHDRISSAPDPDRVPRAPMLKAVGRVLEQLGDEFEFVTVPELMRRGEARRTHWYRHADVAWLNSLETEDGRAWRYPTPAGRRA